MSRTTAAAGDVVVQSGLVWKLFFGLVAFAVISAIVNLGGRFFGTTIVRAGHSEGTEIRRVVIGEETLSVPENTIRFRNQRVDGAVKRLDLYLKWPEMSGYRDSLRDAFNHQTPDPSIIFISFQERQMSRDMSGRFEPIYSRLISLEPEPGPGGLEIYRFKENSGYLDETLFTGSREDGSRFVARCLETDDIIAPCERDLFAGTNLSISYRFPAQKLADWRAIDAAVVAIGNKALEGWR